MQDKNFFFSRLLSLSLFAFFILFLENCNLAECGQISECSERPNNPLLATLAAISRITPTPPRAGISVDATNLSGANDDPTFYDSFANRIADSDWNEQKVRSILHAFAYGGGATDAQITAWEAMGPSRAIVEIIGMWTVNSKLAQASSDGNATINPNDGTLSKLSHYYGTTGPATSRADFEQRYIPWHNSPARTFIQAVATRGLNPVRQKIAFFESNYHLALNQDKNITDVQMFRHYDSIANDLARAYRDELGYEDVLANIALSAPVATQYNHKKNIYQNGAFIGNEDFAREYHQLYFGILGVGVDRSGLLDKNAIPAGNAESFNSHEENTIKYTSWALTDIQVRQLGNDSFSDVATYGTSRHTPGPLNIYAIENRGETAEARIKILSKHSIDHSESKNTLPLIIVAGLADENLDQTNSIITGTSDPNIGTKVARIQALWQSMAKKNFIEFIRKYAISTMFYDPTRVKYQTTVDRTLTNANTTLVTNNELSAGLVRYDWEIYSENIVPFRPEHDVFGGQTGLEASNTDDVFRNAHNTSASGQFGAVGIWQGGRSVRIKDFRNLLPSRSDIQIDTVAEFLWKRLLGDATLSYYGTLEKAHIVALLASGKDLNYFLCGPGVDVGQCNTKDNITSEATITATHLSTIKTAAASTMFKSGATTEEINTDNDRIGSAIDFILATPYVFVQVGK
ncbi:MAG: hypothetical protein KBF93_10260 [Leptospiraceae bacterium]|nr:hypothetical protein [Leptospiraceae bacterium]